MLRPAREADLEELYRLDSDLNERGPLSPVGFTSFLQYKQEYEKNGWWFDNGGGLVITTGDDAIIGRIGCRANGIIAGFEVGYQIFRHQDRGHGYMSDALTHFTKYMFEWKDIPRLYLLIDPENSASVAVAEKNGYAYEGLMRQAAFARGVYRDLAIYGILKHEASIRA